MLSIIGGRDKLHAMRNSLFSLSTRMKRFRVAVPTMEKVNFVCSLSRPSLDDGHVTKIKYDSLLKIFTTKKRL